MDEFLNAMLKMSGLGSMRADESVARQAVMNHGTAAHFLDMMFIRDSCEVSVVEGYAMQGLAMAQLPAQAAAYNLSDRTPVVK